jgi:hypothetical protein
MSGAVFKKLMAEMRSGGMYPYFSKRVERDMAGQSETGLPGSGSNNWTI